MKLSEYIRALRKRKELSQQDLADQSQQVISQDRPCLWFAEIIFFVHGHFPFSFIVFRQKTPTSKRSVCGR